MTKSTSSAIRIAELTKKISNDVRYGAYEFGEWLKIVDLQKRYNAKQFEIRKVLNELKNYQLVEHTVNAGFRVAAPKPEEREQMHYVRIVLERSAAPLIAARATERDIEEITRLAKQFESTIEMKGRQQQAKKNFDFHHRLYAITKNDVLIDLINSLRERSHFGTTGRWRTLEGLKASSDEHMQMIEAIKKRDPTELERIIVQHIESF